MRNVIDSEDGGFVFLLHLHIMIKENKLGKNDLFLINVLLSDYGSFASERFLLRYTHRIFYRQCPRATK